jgi:hypothetical protein
MVKPEYKVVVLTDRPVPMVEDEESIRALATHPGFVALCNRLKLQRAALQTMLDTKKHPDIRAVDDIQAGLKWLGFLQSEVDKTVFRKAEAKAVAVRPTERQEFDKVFRLIEGV